MNRRDFLFISSGALAGSMLVPGLAEPAMGEESLDSGSGLATGTPKPLRHKEVPGFLSSAQIAPHHSAHYGGALKAFSAADARCRFPRFLTGPAAGLADLIDLRGPPGMALSAEVGSIASRLRG